MSSGNWCTRRRGPRMDDSLTSVRATTAPGVTARSLPIVNESGATMVGMCGAEAISEIRAPPPRTRLRPPVSMNAFHATRLSSG